MKRHLMLKSETEGERDRNVDTFIWHSFFFFFNSAVDIPLLLGVTAVSSRWDLDLGLLLLLLLLLLYLFSECCSAGAPVFFLFIVFVVAVVVIALLF